MKLSEKDERLIGLLRLDGRISVSEIARRLSVSRTAAQARLNKLERNGVIKGYGVKLSPDYFESQVRALIMIRFPPARRAMIEEQLGHIEQVISLFSISGTYDLAGMIAAPDMATLDMVIDRIGCLEGIGETMTSIILSTRIDR